MAHLCSRYLEKKLLAFQKSDPTCMSGYRSEDEKYGFLPTPFKHKRKRSIQVKSEDTMRSFEGSDRTNCSRQQKKNAGGLRDITNGNQVRHRTRSLKPQAPHLKPNGYGTPEASSSRIRRSSYKRSLAQEFEFAVVADIDRISMNSSLSSDKPVDKMSIRARSVDTNKRNRPRPPLKDIYQSSTDSYQTSSVSDQTSGSYYVSADSCQSNTNRCQSSSENAQSRLSNSRSIKSQLSADGSSENDRPNDAYPRTLNDVEDALQKATLESPANIVMFVTKQATLNDTSGSLLQYKAHPGMLVSALYAHSEKHTCVALPNGLTGIVSRDVLLPLGVKVSRDFSQQFPDGSSLDSTIEHEYVNGQWVDEWLRRKPNDAEQSEQGGSESVMDSSFFSDGTFVSALSSDLEARSLIQDTADRLGRSTGCTQTNESLISDNSPCKDNVERKALLEYLQLMQTNATIQQATPQNTEHHAFSIGTPKFESVNHVERSQSPSSSISTRDTESSGYSSGFGSITKADAGLGKFATQGINLSMSQTENTMPTPKTDPIIVNTCYASASSEGSAPESNDGDCVSDETEVCTIKLSDITYRPPLIGNDAMDTENTYANIPDIAELLKNCQLSDESRNSSSNNKHSSNKQTAPTPISTQSVSSPFNEQLIDSGFHESHPLESSDSINALSPIEHNAHSRDDPISRGADNISLITRCGSFHNLCQSSKCAMCCPCNTNALDPGTSRTSSRDTHDCIEELSSIHGNRSSTTFVTSCDTSCITSPDSMTSAILQFTSDRMAAFQKTSPNIKGKRTRHYRTSTVDPTHQSPCSKTPRHKSTTKVQRSPPKDIDLLKTIDSIETTDSGNWSEVSTENEDDNEHQPRLTAVFDYATRSTHDVSLRKQDVVTLLNDANSDWLWVRKENGEVGYIPKTYVVNLEKLNLDPHTKTTYL